jgi:transglutaminase-like putative cysteine protease
VTGVLAVAVGLAALAIPLPGVFDVREFIDPPIMLVEDENPLATAARLLRDPPPAAEGVDVAVVVDGESPGRLRMAVLDVYEPEGWRQRAEFAVTGEVVTPSAFDDVPGTSPSSVTVAQGPATTGLRATPTAGSPVGVVDPDGVRFSSAAGLFVSTDASSSVRYRSLPRVEAAPPGAVSAPVGVPAELYRCPDSQIIDDIAGVLSEGTTEPLERLNRIESWLKLTKIYDPEAPGGQTVRSVERFLSQEFARGNLEVLVTAYAVLARCADVPVRVVVGYPAPTADDRREYTAADVEAWVETPIAGAGWVPLDPIPTPEEQQRQAELASQPPPEPTDTPTEPEPTPTEVAPTGVDEGRSVLSIVLLVAALLAAIAAACWLWADGLRRRTLSRRRRVAEPAVAVRFAWRTVVEALLDDGIALGPHLTASETARATTGRVNPAVTRLMSELAGLADRARFDAPSTTDEHAGLAWALADAALERQPMTWGRRLGPLLHPRRAVRRLRVTRGHPRRRQHWTAEVPASALVTSPQDIVVIPGYEVQARIGSGSTSVVYRGLDPSSGRAVAVKVFSIDVGARSFDHQRFAWEARVAELVSGLPNLPEVLSSGVTDGGQPYLVTKLYERGTLHRRVQRGGPLSPGEVASAGRQLAMALETLHQHSILHGDVKPENVFIDDDGSMVLGDLGSAWLRADGGPASMMTPPYAAPEVWLGHAPTIASDIYSLGLTLMYAASARAPMAGSPPREDEIVEAFGSDIVLPLLEVDPRRRPRTALAAAHRLGLDVEEHARRGPTVLALPTPTFSR